MRVMRGSLIRRPSSVQVATAVACVVLAACSGDSSHGASADASFGDAIAASSGVTTTGGSRGSGASEKRSGTSRPGTSHSRSGASEGSRTRGVDGGATTTTSVGPVDAGHDAGPQHLTGVAMAVKTVTGDVMRTYDITLPAVTGTCNPGHKVPVIFAFHGDGGRGSDMYGGFPIEAVVAAAGETAVFVYPDGTDNNLDPGGAARAWDLYHDPGPYPYRIPAGQPAPAMGDQPSGNVDVDFFDQLVALVEADDCVDPAKVFVTGMSSGGYLANQFGRWRSGIIKATAPQSGGAPFGNTDSVGAWTPPNYCIGPTGKVPVLLIHGLSDGTVDPCNAIEAQSFWELNNACSGSGGNCTSTADSCTGSNLASPSTAPTAVSSLNPLCQASEGCGAPVVLCRIPGMGHQIWSDAPQVIWSFFASQ